MKIHLQQVLQATIATVLLSSISFTAYAQNSGTQPNQIQAIYEVPVLDPLLQGAASFGMKIKSITLGDQNSGYSTSQSYELPQALTGVAQEIVVINSSDNPNSFKGPHAESECTQEDLEVACILRYQNLDGSLQQAENFLKSLKLPSDELAKRIRVAKAFSCDPVGVLHFNMNGTKVDSQSALMKRMREQVLAGSSCSNI